MRKVFMLTLIFALALTSCSYAGEIKIGSCIYSFNDAFMLRFRNAMTAESEKLGADLTLADSQNDQETQNTQVDEFITAGVSALIVNMVNRMEAQAILDKAKGANIPVVFINREPAPEVLASYEKAYYVGTRAEESGTQSGELIADYFKAHSEADKNNDGKIQFIMLRGENGHQDMIARSKFSVIALRDAGFEPVELAGAIANWDKLQAMNIMNAFLMSIGPENIEAVIANNDEMALGAVEALKANDYNKGNSELFIPVVGVDGNAGAVDAVNAGEMIGTVLQDAETQGLAAVKIAIALASGQEVSAENIGCEITDGKYVWVPYRKITKGE